VVERQQHHRKEFENKTNLRTIDANPAFPRPTEGPGSLALPPAQNTQYRSILTAIGVWILEIPRLLVIVTLVIIFTPK
jgi:hypothetical protein